MTLIKSISGIRGTIGGKPNKSLTPLDIVKFTSAYATCLKKSTDKRKIVVGRDARTSGTMVAHLVTGTLIGSGFDVVNLGLSTTPTVEMAVVWEQAAGGIILTASHNPREWNALKLLNEKGEFISADLGAKIVDLAEKEDFDYAEIDDIGFYTYDASYIERHIDEILALDLVDVEAIKAKKYKIVVDAVNSTGGISIPVLLDKLGCQVVPLFCDPNGNFPHNPEPLPEHLTELSAKIIEEKAHLGFVCDPDVDRLAIVNEDGSMFGEEYTLVAVADYILKHKKGATVSNLSSSVALKKITEDHGCVYHPAMVGEVNVVAKMKAENAVIGGEGNGGIIYPELHYGRDALVGIALFLTHLAHENKSCAELRATYPDFKMVKDKIQLTPEVDLEFLLNRMSKMYADKEQVTIDGVKVFFSENEWVHLRKSNTEPIIRVYAESDTEAKAKALVETVKGAVTEAV